MQNLCLLVVNVMLKPARRLVDHFPPPPDLEPFFITPTSAKYSTFCPHDKSSIPLLPYLLNIDIFAKRTFARAPYATTTTIMTYVSKTGIRMALYVLSTSIKYSA